jgi:hypothetical protein
MAKNKKKDGHFALQLRHQIDDDGLSADRFTMVTKMEIQSRSNHCLSHIDDVDIDSPMIVVYNAPSIKDEQEIFCFSMVKKIIIK